MSWLPLVSQVSQLQIIILYNVCYVHSLWVWIMSKMYKTCKRTWWFTDHYWDFIFSYTGCKKCKGHSCTLSRPSEKRISMVSFRMGSRPPWWIPMPLFNNGSTCSTWGAPSNLFYWFMAWRNGLYSKQCKFTSLQNYSSQHRCNVWLPLLCFQTTAVYPTITLKQKVFIMWLTTEQHNRSTAFKACVDITCVAIYINAA